MQMNELLIHAVTRTNRRCIMLSEISQTPKTTDCTVLFSYHSGSDQTVDRRHLNGCWGRDGIGYQGQKRAWGGDGTVLYLDCGSGYRMYVFVKTHRAVHQKEGVLLRVNYSSIKKKSEVI